MENIVIKPKAFRAINPNLLANIVDVEALDMADNLSTLETSFLRKTIDLAFERSGQRFKTWRRIGLMREHNGLEALRRVRDYSKVIPYELPLSHSNYLILLPEAAKLQLKGTFFEKYVEGKSDPDSSEFEVKEVAGENGNPLYYFFYKRTMLMFDTLEHATRISREICTYHFNIEKEKGKQIFETTIEEGKEYKFFYETELIFKYKNPPVKVLIFNGSALEYFHRDVVDASKFNIAPRNTKIYFAECKRTADSYNIASKLGLVIENQYIFAWAYDIYLKTLKNYKQIIYDKVSKLCDEIGARFEFEKVPTEREPSSVILFFDQPSGGTIKIGINTYDWDNVDESIRSAKGSWSYKSQENEVERQSKLSSLPFITDFY